MSKYGRKRNKPLRLTFLDKLKICWGIINIGDVYNWRPGDKNVYVFNAGYVAGLADTKRPGLYKVTVHNKDGQSCDYTFDDMQRAIEFASGHGPDSPNPDEGCDFVQTYLDRDLDHLINWY